MILWTAISILFFRWYRRSVADDGMPVTSSALVLALLLAAGACGDAPAPQDEFTGVRVAIAVIAEPVTGERAALYLRVENRGQAPDTLDAVEVEGVGAISLHRTETVDGMMRMLSVEAGLEVPARGTLQMNPGGMHVMLDDLQRPFKAGDRVPVTLHLRRAGTLSATARVSALSALEAALNRR